MSQDSQLPKDSATAAQILADLDTKDESLCRYPLCDQLRQESGGTGRPSAYCQNPEHTAVTNHRARQQLRATVESAIKDAVVSSKQSGPASEAFVSSLRNSVVERIMQLQRDMERYLTALTEMTDPDLSLAQIQATLAASDARIAEAQQAASTERSLRLASDATSMAAQEEAQTEREAAEQAILQMEETEAKLEKLKVETKQQIAEIQAERDETVAHIRAETKRRIEEVERQAKQAVDQAQNQATIAQNEARQAVIRANEAETRANAQIATAERLVAESRTTLERERTEIDRLRQELTATVTEARTRAETERAEYRATLDRERSEVDRLRAELSTARMQSEQAATRAVQLAASNDELRAQLVQIQAGIREKTNH